LLVTTESPPELELGTGSEGGGGGHTGFGRQMGAPLPCMPNSPILWAVDHGVRFIKFIP